MQQCDAITLASSYACAHPCLKKNGLKKVGQRRLCAHHRASKTAWKTGATGGRRPAR
ncbi:MAG: hypothetical protein AAB262_15810 [Elusimicrobiota bacterium]